MPFGYSGTVRAKVDCTHGGFRYSAGAVFEIKQHCLVPEDPFEPVQIIGYREEPRPGAAVTVPICKTLGQTPADLHELNRRGGPAATGELR